MELVFVGLNHRTAPIELRDRLAIIPTRLAAALTDAAGRPGLSEVVLLSTCNRFEVWTVADETEAGVSAIHAFLRDYQHMALDPLVPHLYTHTEASAVRHTLRVVAGLDSMVLGEPQITGQVKEAFEAARAARTSGFLLERLFQHALHTHKRVRNETRLGEGAVSISFVAVELARKIFGDLSQRRVLVLGAGEMSELALECLEGAGAQAVRVSNRTHHKAVELAGRHNWPVIPWEEFPAALAETDVVISSTGAPRPIVHLAMVREAMARRHNEAIFFIDIATPRDIEAEIGNLYNVFLFNLDDLNAIAEENRRRRQSEAELAERIVEAETDVFMRWLATLDIKTTIVELRGAFDELRNQEIEWLRSKLGDLPERDWNAIVQFSNRLTNKLLHRPLTTLRETASEDDAVALAEAVHRLFGLEKETKSKDEG